MNPRWLLPIFIVVLALGLESPAEAHSRPITFTPAPGAIVAAAPTQIQGWFTSDIRRDPTSFVHVFDSAKNRVDMGEVILSTNRRNMGVNVKDGLGPGSYLVHWSTHDDVDGEVFAGCYVFFVGQAAADAAIAKGQPMDGADSCPANAGSSDSSLNLKVTTSGNSATVNLSPTNFTPRAPDGSTKQPGFGHYHIYLDKVPVDAIEGAPHVHNPDADEAALKSGGSADADKLVENPVMWVENSYTFKNLHPGVHSISAALFYDDHTTFSPPVVASQTFTIDGSGGSGGGTPFWLLLVIGFTAVGLGLAGGKLISSGKSVED